MAQEAGTSPNLPWKTRFLMSAISFAFNISLRRDQTVNRRLFNLLDVKSSASNKPKNGVITSDITVNASRNLWFRLYTPADIPNRSSSLPVIIYFHGGGFIFMGANSKLYDDLCHRLARELPSVVISVSYRLAPEHRYPSQYEDGMDVLKFLDSTNIENFPACADFKNSFLAGDSAGGNLAHHVAVQANAYTFSNLKLTGIISIQPFFGGEERTESETRLRNAPLVPVELLDRMWKGFLPEGSDRDHLAANVFRTKSVEISGVNYPATIVFVGGFDPLQDWQKRYYEDLMKCGKEAYLIEYSNACHGFYIFPELPESSLFIKEVKDFIQCQSTK